MTSATRRAANPKALLALARVSNLPTVWMNVLAATALSGAVLSPGVFATLALSMSAFYCGGMALNDLFDRSWDADHQPYRPIPAGAISVLAARRFTGTLFIAALALLSAAPHPRALVGGVVLLVVIVAYDAYHKRHPGWIFAMAATRSLVFLVCGFATSGRVSGWVFLAAGLSFLYTLAITAVARHENSRGVPYPVPVIPRMIAGMSLLDGGVLAIALGPAWLLAGAAAAALTLAGQRFVRGD